MPKIGVNSGPSNQFAEPGDDYYWIPTDNPVGEPIYPVAAELPYVEEDDLTPPQVEPSSPILVPDFDFVFPAE